MKNSNLLNKVKLDIKALPIDKKTLKSVLKDEPSKANYLIRQFLEDTNFSNNVNNELIHCRIIGNHLYLINFMPELNIDVPDMFMYDDVKKIKISNPTIYRKSKKILDVKNVIYKEYISTLKKEVIEVPIQIMAFEVQKGVIFGDYKGYLNLFTVDKALNNKNIPDELDVLIYSSIFQKHKDANVSLTKKTLDEYRKKINNFWHSNNLEFKSSFFKEKNYILNHSLASLVDKMTEKTVLEKAS
jgi:hypothetical protein